MSFRYCICNLRTQLPQCKCSARATEANTWNEDIYNVRHIQNQFEGNGIYIVKLPMAYYLKYSFSASLLLHLHSAWMRLATACNTQVYLQHTVNHSTEHVHQYNNIALTRCGPTTYDVDLLPFASFWLINASYWTPRQERRPSAPAAKCKGVHLHPLHFEVKVFVTLYPRESSKK